MTNHTVRILALVPAARQAATNTWIKNNLDTPGANWLRVGLSATGNAPATFYLFNAALTLAEFKKLAAQLLQMASISLPENFDTWRWRKSLRGSVRSLQPFARRRAYV